MCHDERKSQNKICEYIAVHVNDLYIHSQIPEDTVNTLKTKCRLKIKRNEKLSYDPGGIMVCQLEKYLEELHEKFTRLFKDNPPKDQETLLDKIDLVVTT